MIAMMQGDSYALEFEIEGDDGLVSKALIDDIEVAIGSLRKRMKDGAIKYDDENRCFRIPLTQEETQSFGYREIMQVRVKTTAGNVIGADLGEVNIRQALSKVVL